MKRILNKNWILKEIGNFKIIVTRLPFKHNTRVSFFEEQHEPFNSFPSLIRCALSTVHCAEKKETFNEHRKMNMRDN